MSVHHTVLQATTPQEQDDFPFPSASSPRTVAVDGFLANQDDYQITLRYVCGSDEAAKTQKYFENRLFSRKQIKWSSILFVLPMYQNKM
jgi:hypothetical protein